MSGRTARATEEFYMKNLLPREGRPKQEDIFFFRNRKVVAKPYTSLIIPSPGQKKLCLRDESRAASLSAC